MNEAQVRRYLALLAKAPELEAHAVIRIDFDGCPVEFQPESLSLSWRCLVLQSGADNPEGTSGLHKAELGMLLEANAMGRAATFAMNEAGGLLLRGSTMLNGLTEDALTAQLAEFIDYVEYWQQQLAELLASRSA